MEILENKLLTKLLLKVRRTDSTEFCWVHFCYVDMATYEAFLSRCKSSDDQLNQFLSRWCKEDFGVDLELATMEDLATLKEVVKDHYKDQYPELYRDSRTDKQGWTRIWVTDRMRKETENCGE